MEKYLIGLLAALTFTAHAEITTITSEMECGSQDDAANLLDKFKEMPMLQGLSISYMGKEEIKYPVILFVNPDNGTWTLIEKQEMRYCIVASGEKLQFGPSSNKPNI